MQVLIISIELKGVTKEMSERQDKSWEPGIQMSEGTHESNGSNESHVSRVLRASHESSFCFDN